MSATIDGSVDAGGRQEIVRLTKCSLAPDGERMVLGFRNEKGIDAAFTVSVEQAGALLMTLPGLIERALRLKYRDPGIRYAFPLGDWTLEAAGGEGRMILNLTTPDGFAVSFAIADVQAGDLATALGDAEDYRPATLKQ